MRRDEELTYLNERVCSGVLPHRFHFHKERPSNFRAQMHTSLPYYSLRLNFLHSGNPAQPVIHKTAIRKLAQPPFSEAGAKVKKG